MTAEECDGGPFRNPISCYTRGGGEEEESTIETCEKVLWEFHRESSVRLINSERFV